MDVRFTPAGAPLAVRHDGQVWAVAEEPVHWFTRDSWWDTRRSAPMGVGNVVDIEHWKVQVRYTSDSPLRTFELRRNPPSEQWLLEAVTDN
ncbi:hypothetical protein PY310_19640 [Pseudarthrobacter sp. H3Y2-7]|uniref:hypothetical protein n=1 Tax=Pseudarthrobacter naphthalenicus TaxID=3031328 RepID=UPI0023AE834E|nr:hypothetical protein [Pseudarthrobacter sp. H3Y2-7]MDE8670789.1 hypothetical protein [Pseudarthrobacter sp. H3Y2-7]